MEEVKRIKILSLAKITAAVCGLAGFLVVLLVATSPFVNTISQGNLIGSLSVAVFLDLGVGVLVSLIFGAIAGVFGFFCGFIIAYLYNIFAGRLGGIKIELEEEKNEEIKN